MVRMLNRTIVDDVIWLPASTQQLRLCSGWMQKVFLSTTCIDSIGDFLLATGAELLFNLPPTRLEPPSMSNNSAWNSTNSEELLEHIGKQPYAYFNPTLVPASVLKRRDADRVQHLPSTMAFSLFWLLNERLQ